MIGKRLYFDYVFISALQHEYCILICAGVLKKCVLLSLYKNIAFCYCFGNKNDQNLKPPKTIRKMLTVCVGFTCWGLGAWSYLCSDNVTTHAIFFVYQTYYKLLILKKMKKTRILVATLLLTICFYSVSCSSGSSKDTKVSSGSIDEKDYKPTVDKQGEYKTIDGDNSQVQYQGSQEQKSDLDAIDEYSKEHPGF